METKKFNCKFEEVPVIAGFVSDSLEKDLTTFNEFSPMFDAAYLAKIRTKRNFCLELERSNIKTQRLKYLTAQLVEKETGLRLVMNTVEGYVKLAGSSLDVPMGSFGLLELRQAISRGNDEGVIGGLQKLLININRNLTTLQAKGLKQEVVDKLSANMTEIDTMNSEQNALANERNQTTASNMKDYNELWDLLSPVFETGRLLFRGVDEEKLKQYTIAALIKRVNNAYGNSTDKTTPKTDTPT